MDEGQLGKIHSTIEFPALTKADLEEIHELERALFRELGDRYGQIDGFEKYSGLNERIGFGTTIINSSMTWHQFVFALAFTRHSLVKKIAEGNSSEINAETLVKNKIMAGIKILDLGSSIWPVFARCCRAMGADVWTVDKDQRPFDFEPGYLSEEQKLIESQKHIVLDLEDKDAVDIIKQKSGGNFNLVTESQLEADEFMEGEKIALPLLKKGGVHEGTLSKWRPTLKE